PWEGGGGDGAFRRSSRTRCGGGGGRWHVAQRGSQAFWGQHRQRRALGGAVQSQGRDLAGSDGGRSSFRSYRGPSRLSVRSHRPPAGHDAAGNTGTPDRQLRRAFLVLRALALFRSPWAHLLKKGDYIVDTQRYNRQKKSAHAEEQQRSDVVRQRRDWFAGQLDLDPTRLVFIDETWASTNMARKRGRCRRGRRFYAPPFRTAITRRLRSSPACAFAASWRKRPSTGRSTRPRSRNGWKNVLCPPSRKVTSSSWTICRATRDPGSSNS